MWLTSVCVGVLRSNLQREALSHTPGPKGLRIQLCPRNGHFPTSNRRFSTSGGFLTATSFFYPMIFPELCLLFCVFYQHSLPSSSLEFCTPPSVTPHPFPLQWPSLCLTDLSLYVSTTTAGCLSFQGARVRMYACACVCVVRGLKGCSCAR